jgi:hypothetical protein
MGFQEFVFWRKRGEKEVYRVGYRIEYIGKIQGRDNNYTYIKNNTDHSYLN